MLSYRIKTARHRKGLTQGKLAESLNKSRTTIVNWEAGYVRPDKYNLSLIAATLDVSVEWLLDTSNDDVESMEMKIDVSEPQEMTNAQKIGAKLRYYRKKKGLTGEQVAKYLNVSRMTISGYETGSREPNFETIISLSELYDMSVDYLLGINKISNGAESYAWISDLLSASPEKQEAMKKIWEAIRVMK